MPNWSGSNRDKSQKPKGESPAWLGSGAGGAARKSPARWNSPGKRQNDPEAGFRAVRALFFVAAFALLAGFIYLVLTRPEPTPLISLRAGVYPLQMPPLAFADEDIELLSRISPSNLRVMPVKFDSVGAIDDFRKSLQAAGRRFNYFRRGNDALIVHVAAHGVVNDDGKPCLVPPNADPFDTQTWLSLGKVLDAIREETTLKGKKKLVLLDCQRVLSCWRCGWLEIHFQDSVAAAIQEAGDPDLYLLSAVDVGQINWPAPELRSSAFGHFLARGLRGEGTANSRISLLDVYRFVSGGVDAYSRQRRDIRQQPVLFHADAAYRFNEEGKLVDASGQPATLEEFSLAYVDRWRSKQSLDEIRSSFDPLADAKSLLGQWPTGDNSSGGKSSLNQLWQMYRQRRQPATKDGSEPPAYSIDPVAWSSVQQRLAAIGERLLAGREYQGSALQTEIERLAKDLSNTEFWRPRGALPKLSAFQVARQQPASSEAGASSGENIFSLYLRAEAAKRAEVMPKRVGSVRLVKDVYSALVENSSGGDARANLQAALELFDHYRLPSDPYLLEEHFLKLLDRGLPADELLSAAQLAAALKARHNAELAANPSDCRVHYAMESMINAADEKRREAEDISFLGTEVRRSEALWREAVADLPGSGYGAAMSHENRLAESMQLRDEIWADLPFVAEWNAYGEGDRSPSQQIISVIQGSIDLDDAVERALRSHDEPATLTARLDRQQRAYDEVSRDWEAVRSRLENVYDLPTNVEQAYRRGAYIRAAEAALRFPPLGGSSSQFVERYLQTLDQWAEDKLPSAGHSETAAAGEPKANGDSSNRDASRDRSEFYQVFREIHRALAYEFVDPYEQHRHVQPWDQNLRPDVVFRTAGQDLGWRRIRKSLDAYNEAISKESPTWSASQSAVAASARLRQWDRRVRVAGPWLASFRADLQRPNQPTPTRWLQEFDAAHWSTWQAYRAKCDFWGNGQAPGTGNSQPYFAQAIEQCEAVLPESLRPIRYDIPGGGAADFSERSSNALAALDRWEPIGTPRSARASARNSGEVKVDMAIQPMTADKNEIRLPVGVATLSIQRPATAGSDAGASSITGSFNSEGNSSTRAVPLPLRSEQPISIAAFLHVPADPQAVAGELDARLWYRGHVRAKPLPLPRPAGSQFVEYEFVRPNYNAPTVEVRGNSAIYGAVLFIFDCSASMTGNRFVTAKQKVMGVLDRLAKDAGPNFRVGLMAYGTRTKAFGREDQPDLYYQFRSHPDRAPLLTTAGQTVQQQKGAQFAQLFPHPDRDLLEMTPVAGGTPAQVKAALNQLNESRCMGCTPLYYSIAQAMRNGFRGVSESAAGVRQIVVVSDGINMPYNCSYDERTGNYTLGATGQLVNEEDHSLLERTLDSAPGIQVTVQLIGDLTSDFDKHQYDSLKRIQTQHGNLKVVTLPDAQQLEQSIMDSFPRASATMHSAQTNAPAQSLGFNQAQAVADWPMDGLLRREAARETVQLRVPGEGRTTDKDLDLLGGERVILQYEQRDSQLTFSEDGLTRRGTAVVQPPRASDNRRLLLDALDPERVGLAVNMLNFRLRDDDSSRRFTPRPKYVWLEVRPILAGGAPSDRAFPCIDVSWKENINLPRLAMPVQHWPECTTARVKALLRYTDPLLQAQVTIPRDRDSQTITAGADKWQIEQTGGDGGEPRKITVSWEPGDSTSGLANLIERAVWLSPPPDVTRRQYALDGSAAIHEFTYNREGVGNVDIRVATRSQFEQGAYSAELEFDVAN